MQRLLSFHHRSEDEEIKEAGLVLDFDEIARKGKMSKEEELISKWYGIYASRQPGNHMARVVIPGGQLTSSQARVLAKTAELYAQGKLAVTTRQAIQMHWIKTPALPDLLRALAEEGLTTFHGCGDVTRNVAACPLSETCVYQRINVLPYAKETAKLLSNSRDLDNLPRKFKITYSGCGAGCAQPYINCVGIMGVLRNENPGFKVVIGGGMGWKPFVAQELFSFVPPDKISRLCRAIGLLFRDHGNRRNRAHSRLKFVVEKYGIEKCRDIILKNLKNEQVNTDNIEIEPFEDKGISYPDRPLTENDPVGTDGLVTVRAMIPKGEITHHQFLQLAELSEIYGDKRIYTTNRQNIEIHGVIPENVKKLKSDIAQIGFATDGFYGLQDIVPCVGKKYCPKAVSHTHPLYDQLLEIVKRDNYKPISDKVNIHITGCPNSCSPYYIADIGLRGTRIRDEIGSSEGFEIRVGGNQQEFGEKLGEFKTEDCPSIVKKILDTFLEQDQDKKTLNACLKSLRTEYPKAPPLSEFSEFTGTLDKPLDFKTLAKDIPCLDACPAKTNVPAYIQALAEGDPERAYKINQEDNVFPGVLGRICTRPCETACRHNWTGLNGPVHICHLKRFAADGTETIQPLPPWFENSSFKVAIVGGGPAGLTVARELRRLGHAVTIFEKENYLGGMMKSGIPQFRLPHEVTEKECQSIIASGIEVQFQQSAMARDIEKFCSEFDAVLIATGASKPSDLKLPGLQENMAFPGLEFMKKFNFGKIKNMKGQKVVIIGGGFTAVDCARSCARAARRLVGGEGTVSIMYRRTEAQMSAHLDELEALREENINIETLVSPVAAKTEQGKLSAITFRRNKLGEIKPGQKPPIQVIPESDFDVPCNLLIVAIGQVRDMSIFPEHLRDHKKIFLAGDFNYGGLDVIHAVEDGKKAASRIDQFLTGKIRLLQKVTVESINTLGETGRVRDHDLQTPKHISLLPLAERDGISEVELGLDDEALNIAATRCYFCHYKYEIDQDKCIHCDWCIKVAPRDCIKKISRLFHDEDGALKLELEAELPEQATYIWINSNECIRCGNCLRVCPTKAISMRKMDLNTCPLTP